MLGKIRVRIKRSRLDDFVPIIVEHIWRQILFLRSHPFLLRTVACYMPVLGGFMQLFFCERQ